MRRSLMILACLGVLVFAGAGTALARGPHQGPPVFNHGHGHGHGAYSAPWNTGYRGGQQAYCAPGRRVAAYPAYPVYSAPAYGLAYPQLGFGVAGRNFSFWLTR